VITPISLCRRESGRARSRAFAAQRSARRHRAASRWLPTSPGLAASASYCGTQGATQPPSMSAAGRIFVLIFDLPVAAYVVPAQTERLMNSTTRYKKARGLARHVQAEPIVVTVAERLIVTLKTAPRPARARCYRAQATERTQAGAMRATSAQKRRPDGLARASVITSSTLC
jgi:hypothetical protein